MAVFELVKNAYDADAETVTVTIDRLKGGDPRIVVTDNGDGMSPVTVKDICWCPPTTTGSCSAARSSERA